MYIHFHGVLTKTIGSVFRLIYSQIYMVWCNNSSYWDLTAIVSFSPFKMMYICCMHVGGVVMHLKASHANPKMFVCKLTSKYFHSEIKTSRSIIY